MDEIHDIITRHIKNQIFIENQRLEDDCVMATKLQDYAYLGRLCIVVFPDGSRHVVSMI